MPYRFRKPNMSIRPVNRIKHVVDLQGATTAGVQANNNLIAATDTPTLAATSSVETGSKVNGIFLNVEVLATTSAAISNCYLAIFKNPGGNITVPTINVVGANDNKRFCIHQEMVLLQKQDGSNPRTLFKGVIAIPRGYRRFAPNDTLSIHIFPTGVSVDFCFQCHYKEFR